MNEKEFNLAILAELKRIANEVFAKVTVSKEGTYTAAELWNEKDAFGESIVIDYNGTESEIYTAEIGTFKMQITPQKLWYVLWKFEKLCNVKQDKKCRFTFGEPEGEAIKEKAMYRNSKTGETITRKKSMIKVCDNIAFSLEKGQTNPIILYYLVGELWYQVGEAPDKETMKQRVELLKRKDFILNNLKRRPELMDEKNSYGAIFRTLYDVLCAEHIECKAEEGKPENEPENTVICEVVTGRTNDGVLRVEQKELKRIGNSLYKDDKDIYFWYGIYCYCIGAYTRGVAAFLKEQGNNIREKIREMIEQGGITTESAKILYEEMRKKDAPEKPESVHGTNDDYPPEPYNKEKSENVATSYERFQDRTICGRFRKNMRPNYLRQKVFPAERLYVRFKISRFKPRYFVGYTNYHICKENSLERERNGNTSVYRALIRGETKNNILICR